MYSPFNRIYTVNFSVGQNQSEHTIVTVPKRSMVFLRYVGGGGNLRFSTPADGVYFYTGFIKNVIANTSRVPNGITNGGSIAPAGSAIKTNFNTSSGTSNFVLDIVEID